MINTLSIRNFKSIRELDIEPRRVNVFIGEHNSGKSNILEALSWFSTNALTQGIFKEIFRFKNSTDFFYDFDASKPIEIRTSDLSLILRYANNKDGRPYNYLEGLIYPSGSNVDLLKTPDFSSLQGTISDFYAFKLAFDGTIDMLAGSPILTKFRMYQFRKPTEFQNSYSPFLSPPFGENIPFLLIANNAYKETVRDLFKEKGFRLMLKPTEGDLNMAKDSNDDLYAYPYASISETLQRIIFYRLAIETNKNAILIFDEPDANTFPMYTKEMAELIALDSENQYFIATHNPYLLSSLVSKTPMKDLAVFVTQMENYQTKVNLVKDNDLSALLDKGVDVFFNLNKLISE